MIKKKIQQILDSGIDENTEFHLKRKIRTINIVSLLLLLINFIYIFRMLLMELPLYTLIHIGGMLLMGSVIILNKYNRYYTAKVVFFTAIPYFIFLSAIFFNFGAEHYLFPLFIIAAFVFEKRKSLIIYITFFAVLYGLIRGGFFTMPGIEVEPSVLLIVNVVNAVIAMLFCFLTIGLFTKEYENNRSAILKQKSLLEELTKDLEENVKYSNLLTKEMNHRVKNNLQLISSLLNIHSKKLPDENSRNAIIDAKNRIFAIALIHKQLYKDSNISMINMSEYLNDLLSHIRESVFNEEEEFELVMNTDDFSVRIDDAVSIGLVLNELITNSVKHGLNGSPDKRIELNIKIPEKDKILLSIQDGGVGIKKLTDSDEHGFGFELVESMVANFDGRISIDEKANKLAIQLNCVVKESVLVY